MIAGPNLLDQMVTERDLKALRSQRLPETELGRLILNATSQYFNFSLKDAAIAIRQWCDAGDRDALDLILHDVAERFEGAVTPSTQVTADSAIAAFVRAARQPAPVRVH